MRPPDLTHAEYLDWLNAQAGTHQQRIRVRVLNLDHRVLHELTDLVVDGDVTIDVTRDVTRKLSLTLADPARSIGWEPDSVTGVPRYGSRMLRVDVLTRVPELDRWVPTPVFTGPVSDFARKGAEVNISCDSKERLALGSFPAPRTFRRKTRVTTVIRSMLRLTGERYVGRIPNLPATLPEDITVSREDSPWKKAQGLARSIDRVLFYDARGAVRLVQQPNTPSMKIPPHWLTAPVEVKRQDVRETPNRWIVVGPKPKGGKRRVVADVQAPRRHPLSRERDGRRIWYTERIERRGLKTRYQARRIGLRRRDEAMTVRNHFVVECLNLPHITEWDLLTVRDPSIGTFWVRIRQATIPLDGSPMTIGTVKRRRTTWRGPRRGAT